MKNNWNPPKYVGGFQLNESNNMKRKKGFFLISKKDCL